MKLGKLSLVAALAMTTGVFASDATDSMKFEGQLKAWYQTMDHEGVSNGQSDKGLFQRDANQPNEWGNIEAQLSVSGEANDHLKYKVTGMTVTTFGMDSQITAGQTARPSQFGASNGYDAQPFWIHEAYLDYKLGKNTNVKAGRMELDTPLAYTEKWNATANSFEAIVAVNTDLPDTTVVAAWVSKGNGATDNLVYAPQVFGAESQFSNYMGYKHNGNDIANGGAAVLGLVNNSVSFMPVQAWGYFIPQVGQAYWLQADASAKDMGPINKASLQLIGASIGTKGATQAYLDNITSTKDTTAVAAKVAMSAGMFSAYAAFSTIGKGNLPVANTATNYKKTKLPTASIFNDGMVAAQPDTTSYKVGASANFDGIGTLALSYGSYEVGQNAGYLNPNANVGGPASMGYIAQNFLNKDVDVNEIDVVFKTKVKDVDLAAMYIKVNKTYVPILNNTPSTANYGELSNDIVRIVATLKF
jgi:imipenem/basic amino acid-specific outer membrane pore